MEKIDQKWITKPDEINSEVVETIRKIGKELADNKLSASTIRRFFGEMRRIQSNFDSYKEDIPLLRAKLAYDAGRKNEKGVKDFYTLLSPAIEAVGDSKENFNRFVKISEAIVAFHKLYYVGKED
jgi:CRISPR-associated protein Csm2